MPDKSLQAKPSQPTPLAHKTLLLAPAAFESRGKPLPRIRNPFISSNPSVTNYEYHSLHVMVTRRFKRGLTGGAAWTWSKAMDYADSDTSDLSALVDNGVWNYGNNANNWSGSPTDSARPIVIANPVLPKDQRDFNHAFNTRASFLPPARHMGKRFWAMTSPNTGEICGLYPVAEISALCPFGAIQSQWRRGCVCRRSW